MHSIEEGFNGETIDVSNNPSSIDWQLCVKLANNKPDLAKELLAMFIDELPQVRTSIMTAQQEADYDTLYKHVHKLHGTICYCGFPKLKTLVMGIESALKTQQHDDLREKIQALVIELDNINAEYQANNVYSQ